MSKEEHQHTAIFIFFVIIIIICVPVTLYLYTDKVKNDSKNEVLRQIQTERVVKDLLQQNKKRNDFLSNHSELLKISFYTRGAFGVSQYIRLKNNSMYAVEQAFYKLDYLNSKDGIIQSDVIKFYMIDANSEQSIKIKTTQYAKWQWRPIKIVCEEIELNFENKYINN